MMTLPSTQKYSTEMNGRQLRTVVCTPNARILHLGDSLFVDSRHITFHLIPTNFEAMNRMPDANRKGSHITSHMTSKNILSSRRSGEFSTRVQISGTNGGRFRCSRTFIILVNYAYKRPYIVNIEEKIWVNNM